MGVEVVPHGLLKEDVYWLDLCNDLNYSYLKCQMFLGFWANTMSSRLLFTVSFWVQCALKR